MHVKSQIYLNFKLNLQVVKTNMVSCHCSSFFFFFNFCQRCLPMSLWSMIILTARFSAQIRTFFGGGVGKLGLLFPFSKIQNEST